MPDTSGVGLPAAARLEDDAGAQDLASSLRPYLRTHYVQSNVGHYGVFSGKRWQNHIYPLVRDVIHISQ